MTPYFSDIDVKIIDEERRKKFIEVFGTDTVPIVSPYPRWIKYGNSIFPAYFLNLDLIRPEHKENLIKYIVKEFKLDEKFVRENLPVMGLPIKAENCIIWTRNPQYFYD